RRVLRFLIVYSASAKVSWLMIESVYVGNGVNYARLEQFFRGSLTGPSKSSFRVNRQCPVAESRLHWCSCRLDANSAKLMKINKLNFDLATGGATGKSDGGTNAPKS
ncbi:hypothetical protein, partial [Microbulbifer discodermiae]|uniref:hypothetical protein n=1 Tax=Microbulbifer sp. 2201CG32-9 TaxID=3232309 RepID=UPI00345B7393